MDNIVTFPGNEGIKNKKELPLTQKLDSLTYSMHGQLNPLVLSEWLMCKGCAVTFKIGTHVPVFIEHVKESWDKAAKQNAAPIMTIGWKCEHCSHVTNVAITEINIKISSHREDGTDW